MSTQNTQSEGVLFDHHLAYALLRAAIGLALLMHGITRVFVIGDATFATGMVHTMSHSPLPEVLVRPFGIVLPFFELILGFLLLVGLWTRIMLSLGALLMLVLIFGSGLNNEWSGVSVQLTYAAVFAALLGLRRYDFYSLDRLRHVKK